MITLMQRVSEAKVVVDTVCIGQIGQGLLVLVGVQPDDDGLVAQQFVDRLLNYRVFPDQEDRMNLSLLDIHGGLLLVPQFTLAANTRKGRRPSFTSAASPQHGEQIFEKMLDYARQQHDPVESGQFGADMKVHLINDGPVTFIHD